MVSLHGVLPGFQAATEPYRLSLRQCGGWNQGVSRLVTRRIEVNPKGTTTINITPEIFFFPWTSTRYPCCSIGAGADRLQSDYTANKSRVM